MTTKWVCSQFGAREKYAIPLALHQVNCLSLLITDIWISPKNIFNYFFKDSQSRYNDELKESDVKSFNARFLGLKSAERLLSRQFSLDQCYDNLVANNLPQYVGEASHFFSYSYTARQSFKVCKRLGLKTILGQINPGPKEAELVKEEYKRFENGIHKPNVPTAEYWDRWLEEVAEADTIMVNSIWSQELLVAAGVEESKCVIVPLAYGRTVSIERRYEHPFTKGDPLKLLYLGGIELRKGFHILIAAMRLLENLPVSLDVVGGLRGPATLLTNLPSNVTYHGLANTFEVDRFYNSADVFIFPTLSDGFGLTQLEAQAYKLPIVASSNCARVITHMENGLILKDVTSKAIKQSIEQILDQPYLLQFWSDNSVNLQRYSIPNLAESLRSI
jgi:glycosyltransferase involved in cell wall biosynthesis